MPELSGNLSGLRESTQKHLKELYDVPVGPTEFLPAELAGRMAELTGLINREIAVYIARSGEILSVTVGQSDSVPLEDFGQRRSLKRLSRVRCVHTHPNGDEILSDVDLAAVESLRLDAMCALGVNASGRLTAASLSFLSQSDAGALKAGPIQRVGLRELDDPKLMEAIRSNDLLLALDTETTLEDRERAFLISVDTERSLLELAALAESAGAQVVGSALQGKTRPDPVTYIGSGKAGDVALQAQASAANLLIVDDEISAVQARRLEEIVGIPVIDRTALILDIFAQRAVSSEGKLQVALAQLNYKASRLIGARAQLSRLAGGIGTRGPGESKLEMDRRHIRARIQRLKADLKELERQREIRRRNRQGSDILTVALVGYTNTGKSTLLNLLSGADVLVKDQLFATLDTVSRRVTLRDGDEFLLSDSVGFISKLPTDLVEAFRSTLDEALGADILVIVSDASNPQALAQREVVEEVLASQGATEQPRIEVYNKWDTVCNENRVTPTGALKVSAKTGEGIPLLLDAITALLRRQERTHTLLIPFDRYSLLGEIRRQGRIIEETHGDEGTLVRIRLNHPAYQRLMSLYGELFRRAGG